MRPGVRGGDILDARVRVMVENPVDVGAEVDMRFANLPGDFEVGPQKTDAATNGPAPRPGLNGEGVGGLRRWRINVGASSVEEVELPLAGHVEQLTEVPGAEALEMTEHFNGAVLRLPVQLPVYRMKRLEEGAAVPRMDGVGDDWALGAMEKVFGEMKVGTRYLSRVDLLGGVMRGDEKAASVRWTYDADYIYMLAKCPQEGVSDDRNTEWPVVSGAGGSSRWWGTDGVQVVMAPMGNSKLEIGNRKSEEGGAGGERVVRVGFKPSGVVMVQTGTVVLDAKGLVRVVWKDGAPVVSGRAGNLKYGVMVQRDGGRVVGYTVEAAVPRSWIEGTGAEGANRRMGEAASEEGRINAPAWRLNVLRHRAGELVSSSWAGPVVGDEDVGMMGVVIGE
jgi:hypothetical protein